MSNVYLIVTALTLIAAVGNVSGVLNAMAADYYPTHINAMALSLILTFNKLGAFVGTMVVGSLIFTSCEAVFFGFGLIVFVTAGLAYLLPDGKKLDRTSQ